MDNQDRKIFETLLKSGNVPISEAEWEAKLEGYLKSEDSALSNRSPQSPFYRILKALAVKPAAFVVEVIITKFLANAFLKTAEQSSLSLHAWGQNTAPLPATKAKGNLTFTRSSTSTNLSIPKGTLVESLPLGNEQRIYRLITNADASFSAGSTSLVVAATAEQAGVSYNLGIDRYVVLPTPISGIASVTNASGWLTSAGTDAEDLAAIKERLRGLWNANSGWFNNGTYRGIIAGQVGTDPRLVYFSDNAPRGAGSRDVFVMLEVGRVSADALKKANDYLAAGNKGFSDDLVVKAIPLKTIALTVSVRFATDANTAEKSATLTNITNFIGCAARENNAYPEVSKCFAQATFSVSNLLSETINAFPLAESIIFSTIADIELAIEQLAWTLKVQEA